MAPNAKNSKKFYKIEAKGNNKSRSLDQMEKWQNTPAHRWIPIISFQITNHGYLSPRQAAWIEEQLKRLQITISFKEAKVLQ